MKIIIDSAIPYIKGIFEPYFDVLYKRGVDIENGDLIDADAMIIRTRTKCDEALLKGSSVKWIGSATIGFDHIDTVYCRESNIAVQTAAGCNAWGVVQYVVAAIGAIHCSDKNIDPKNTTIGIIGVGNVGRALNIVFKKMGFNTLLNDPIRSINEPDFEGTELAKLLQQSDIVTIHVPLTRQGEHKTFEMVDDAFFRHMGQNKVFINASRGEVVVEQALKDAIKSGIVDRAVLDVWCNEPNIGSELCDMAFIATPHIAGYSVQGKANGSSIMVRGLADFANIPELLDWYPDGVNQNCRAEHLNFDNIRLEMANHYDILSESYEFKQERDRFEAIRNSYNYRDEFF